MQNTYKRNMEFHQACRNGDLKKVKEFIIRGVDIDMNESRSIREASSSGNIDVIKYLIEEVKVKIDTNYIKDICLNGAIKTMNKKTIEYFLSIGANLNDKKVASTILNQIYTKNYEQNHFNHEKYHLEQRHHVDDIDLLYFMNKGLKEESVDNAMLDMHSEEYLDWWLRFKGTKKLHDCIQEDMKFFEDNQLIIRNENKIKKNKI